MVMLFPKVFLSQPKLCKTSIDHWENQKLENRTEINIYICRSVHFKFFFYSGLEGREISSFKFPCRKGDECFE